MALPKRSEIFSRFNKPAPALDERIDVNFFRNPLGINELTFVKETPIVPVHLDLEFLARDVSPLKKIEMPPNDLEIIRAYENFINERSGYVYNSTRLTEEIIDLSRSIIDYQEELGEFEKSLMNTDEDEIKGVEQRIKKLRRSLVNFQDELKEKRRKSYEAQKNVESLKPPVEDIEDRYNRVIEEHRDAIEIYKRSYGDEAERSVRLGILPFSTRVYTGKDDSPLNEPSTLYVPEEIMLSYGTKWINGELIPYRVHVDIPGLQYSTFKNNFLADLEEFGYVMRNGVLNYSRKDAPYEVKMIITNTPCGPNNAVLDVKSVEKLGGSELGRVVLWMKTIKGVVE